MKNIISFVRLFCVHILFTFTLLAQQNTGGYNGLFTASQNGETVVLNLISSGNDVTGDITSSTGTAQIVGTITGNYSEGLVTDGSDVYGYKATLQGNDLQFVLLLIDPTTYQTVEAPLPFKRGAAQATTPTKPNNSNNATSAAIDTNTPKPTASNIVAQTTLTREWTQLLNNCRLTYMESYNSSSYDYNSGYYSGGGYSIDNKIDLCAKGYFLTQSSNNMTMGSDVVSSYGQSKSSGEGTWQVTEQGGTAVLLLHFHDGSSRQYRLGFENGKTFLDGKRWYRTNYANDGAQYAPNCD